MTRRFLKGLGLFFGVSISLLAATPRTVLFVVGPDSHGPGEHRFAESAELLAAALDASGLPVKSDVSRGWPAEDVLAQADALVIYSDGLGDHVAAGHETALRRHLAEGRGLAVLHFALEPHPGPLADLVLEAVGGRFETDRSVNPVWTLRDPILAEHPVTRGITSFESKDEWYFHLRFRPGAVPLLQGHPPVSTLGNDGPRSGNPSVRAALAKGEPQTLAWAYETNGRRAFGFTGGHYLRNWTEAPVRTLVLNGIAWIARVEIPPAGVPSNVATAPKYGTIDEAIARGDLEDVRLHLAQEPARLHGKLKAPLAPLHQAILRNRTEIALALIAAGADVDQPDGSRRTPLHLATERGNVDVTRALLAKKARPNEHDKIGWTPLHHAAAKDRLEVARALLAGGADPMTLSERGGTPLHEAAASGSAEMVTLLLEHKVDPAIVSKLGVTALDIAREYRNEVAIALLEAVQK